MRAWKAHHKANRVSDAARQMAKAMQKAPWINRIRGSMGKDTNDMRGMINPLVVKKFATVVD